MQPFKATTLRAAACLAGALCAALAFAQGASGDAVLVDNGKVKLYRSEYDAELLKLPADIRPGFANSQKRINDLLQRMMVQKMLAVEARDRKLDQTPVNQTRVRLESERLLAALRVEDIEASAGREFDARRSQYEARARELYLVDRKRFEVPEEVSASHILFDLRKHSREEGLKLAEDARAKVLAGADFNELARKVSEDPSVAANAGKIGWFGKGQMDPAFTDAAFALKRPGEVSAPVLSTFGWHVIKLEERRPASVKSFDQVKDQVLAEMRQQFVEERRENAVRAITSDPAWKVNDAAVSALYVRADTDAALRAIDSGKPRPADSAAPASPASK
jgi:peptidyl-prolyl cis-trans isomerase C